VRTDSNTPIDATRKMTVIEASASPATTVLAGAAIRTGKVVGIEVLRRVTEFSKQVP
jgi:hypothetical protein